MFRLNCSISFIAFMTDMMKKLHKALKFHDIDFNNNKKSETNATVSLQCGVKIEL